MNDLHPENNKIFAELAGIPWDTHEGRYGNFNKNPNYAADPRLVLIEMMKRGDFHGDFGFQQVIGGPEYDKINLGYIIDDNGELETTGRARDAAIKFMEEAKCSDQ